MSLTQEIKDPKSRIGGFVREVFPSKRNRRLLAEIKGVLDGGEPVCLLEKGTPAYVHGLIGHAIDYRIRYHFAHTPADRLDWAQQGAWMVTRQPEGLPSDCTLEFFDLVDRIVSKIAPHRRQPVHEEELEITRYCLILAIFEGIRRSGGQGRPPSFFAETASQDATGLLDAIPESWVRDTAELAGIFAASRADWRGAPATLNPEFAGASDVDGADGDLIVDGCLWDIKTTIKNRADGILLYQLLGYVLLDYEDEHAIESVGFLFPRQNDSIHWPLAELMRELSGQADISVSGLRQQLRRRLRPAS